MNRSHDFEEQQVETTRLEKILALALVVFLLIGGFWVLRQLERIPTPPSTYEVEQQLGIATLQDSVNRLQSDVARAQEAANQARQALDQAQADYEFRREEYRTALDAGVDSPEKKQAYERARDVLDTRTRENEAAQTLLQQKQQALAGPREELQQKRKQLNATMNAQRNRYELQLFALRFGYAVPVFAVTVYLWQRLRNAGNRYLIVATAFVAAASIQVIFLTGRYALQLLRDVAPIAISIAGAGISIAGIIALRRYLFSFERVSTARLRKGECPFCGFPDQAGSAHCANCGEQLSARCANCGQPRPRLLDYCPHCGAGPGEV